MSEEAKWIIGSTIVLGGLILVQGERINGRIDRIDDRLRTVEIDMGQVKTRLEGMDSRLASIEAAHGIPTSGD